VTIQDGKPATAPRSPLRERGFSLIWAGGLISDTGDWLLLIALPIYVFSLTGSALSTSTVFLAELVPAVLLGSFAGVLVDRWDQRRTMARLVWSPLGGLAIAAVGPRGVVAIDAGTYLVSAALIAANHPACREPDGELPHPARFFRQWFEGARVVGRVRPLRLVLAITALGQFAQGIFVVLFVVFVLRILGGTGTEVGLLRGVQAIGGAIGGLLVGAVARLPRPAALVGYGYLAFGTISLLTWNAPKMTTALGLYTVSLSRSESLASLPSPGSRRWCRAMHHPRPWAAHLARSRPRPRARKLLAYFSPAWPPTTSAPCPSSTSRGSSI
jgi:MFS family permease